MPSKIEQRPQMKIDTALSNSPIVSKYLVEQAPRPVSLSNTSTSRNYQWMNNTTSSSSANSQLITDTPASIYNSTSFSSTSTSYASQLATSLPSSSSSSPLSSNISSMSKSAPLLSRQSASDRKSFAGIHSGDISSPEKNDIIQTRELIVSKDTPTSKDIHMSSSSAESNSFTSDTIRKNFETPLQAPYGKVDFSNYTADLTASKWNSRPYGNYLTTPHYVASRSLTQSDVPQSSSISELRASASVPNGLRAPLTSYDKVTYKQILNGSSPLRDLSNFEQSSASASLTTGDSWRTNPTNSTQLQSSTNDIKDNTKDSQYKSSYQLSYSSVTPAQHQPNLFRSLSRQSRLLSASDPSLARASSFSQSPPEARYNPDKLPGALIPIQSSDQSTWRSFIKEKSAIRSSLKLGETKNSIVKSRSNQVDVYGHSQSIKENIDGCDAPDGVRPQSAKRVHWEQPDVQKSSVEPMQLESYASTHLPPSRADIVRSWARQIDQFPVVATNNSTQSLTSSTQMMAVDKRLSSNNDSALTSGSVENGMRQVEHGNVVKSANNLNRTINSDYSLAMNRQSLRNGIINIGSANSNTTQLLSNDTSNRIVQITSDSFHLSDDYYLKQIQEILGTGVITPFYYLTSSGPACLLDFLFIGGYRDADDIPGLRRNGITHVLNCAASPDRMPPHHIAAASLGGSSNKLSPYPAGSSVVAYEQFDADDDESYDILQHFEQARQFVDRAKYTKGRCLVHCAMGINRSGAICAAYIMADQQMKLLDVVRLMKQRRGTVLCNRGFQRLLVRFARQRGLL